MREILWNFMQQDSAVLLYKGEKYIVVKKGEYS